MISEGHEPMRCSHFEVKSGGISSRGVALGGYEYTGLAALCLPYTIYPRYFAKSSPRRPRISRR